MHLRANENSCSQKRYTFEDIYNAAATDRNFNYAFWLEIFLQLVCTNAVYYFGYFLVMFVLGLVALLGYAAIFIVLPSLESTGFNFTFHAINGNFILFNIYFNYLLAFLTNPGNPGMNIANNIEEGSSRNYKYCKKCNVPKPPRTHHCSICRKCVSKMDHHCPYISNW